MDSTQMINDSNLESDDAESEEEQNENQRGQPLAKLCVLKNEHIPETEFPLFVGDNVLGRDPNTCSLPLPASSISKKHAIISISVYRRRGAPGDMGTEALVWDLGSMNGTRKGRLKLTPDVRYALSDSDSLVLADIPCQYVTVDTVSMREDTRTPVSRNLGVKAGLPGASGENGGDKSTNIKKCVNGGTNATASLTKTPVRMDCLSFEQTPTHPQGTLVPESDSDSDEERGRVKALVSESDSHKSSPTCSTFLSPTNKIVPESEDESPITPSSSKNRPYRHVSFSKEETEVDVFGQLLEEKKAFAIVDDSEEEEGREEERATLEGTKSHTSGQHVPMTEERNISLSGEDELPVCTTTPTKDVISAFNMDSDTDVEGEEEGMVSSPPVTSDTNPLSCQLPNTAEFHMDSDTDVDEDEDEVALDKSKMVVSPDDSTKPPHVNSVIPPEGVTVDSDTDVDDDAPVSGANIKEKPVSSLSAPTADAAPSTQVKDFHLDSDTDVDEEEESGCETHKPHSKVDKTPTRLDVKTNGAESASAIHNLQLDSDTDDEEMPTPNLAKVSAVDMESCTVTDVGPDILSDSDTDVEDSSPQVTPVAVTASPVSAGVTSEALQSNDTDTDVDESSEPLAEDGANPPDHRGDSDSDTDVEDKEADVGQAGDDHIPSLCRESTPRWLVPLLQKSSTPLQLTEEELENMDTQAFLSPSMPFRREVAPAIGAEGLSSCSGSQEDEDFVVAETQSFVLQNQDCQNNPSEDPTQSFGLEMSGDENDEESTQEGSFQLGLSDSSHLQCQAQALAMESTQAFVTLERNVNLEDTQAYVAALAADIGPNPGATQAHKEAEEPARCSGMSEKAGQKGLAFEETQAYISKSCSDSDDETDEDERKNTIAMAETQPLDILTTCTLAMAETQLISAFEEEESLVTDKVFTSAAQVKPITQNDTEESEQQGETAQPQQGPTGDVLSMAETQPMSVCDDEYLFPGPQKRRAKPLHLEEHQTQPFISSDFSVAETQPIATSENEASDDDEDSMSGPRKRRAKALLLETETQPFLAVGTQPIITSEGEQSDEDNSTTGPRKRKAKRLHLEEEETETPSNSELSAFETQPVDPVVETESQEEDSVPILRERRAKALQIKVTQSLSDSEVSAVVTNRACEGEQSDEDNSTPGPRKRKAKRLHLEEEETETPSNSELAAFETQPVDPVEGTESQDEDSVPILRPRKRKAKALQLEEEETQPLSVDTQPVVGGEDKSDDEDTGPCETKAKALQPKEEKPLPVSEVSAVESGVEPMRQRGTQSEAETSGVSARNKRVTRARLKDKEEQAECSELPQRRTRGKNKALASTRGRMGRSRPDGSDSEEDREAEQALTVTEKKSMRQQRNNKEEEKCETEKRSLIQERQGEWGEERAHHEREKGKIGKEEQEQGEMDRRNNKEEQENVEREQKNMAAERIQAENAERIRFEQERAKKERKKQEEKERVDQIRREKEAQLKKERKEKEEKERLEHENAEREKKEKLEREEREMIDKERKEREERERLETEKRKLEERLARERKEEEQIRLQREEKEERERLAKECKTKEKETNEHEENKDEVNKAKVPARGRRAARRSNVDQSTIEQESILASDDVPARRTRSRSNSSNSISSERSASSVSTQPSRGRGRGRGAKRMSEIPQTVNVRSSNRRRTVAAAATDQDVNDFPLSRSNSSTSLNSDISGFSVSSLNRGRGSQRRGRSRTSEAATCVKRLSDDDSLPQPTARGRNSRKTQGPANVFKEDDEEKVDSQQTRSTRGQRRATRNPSVSNAADEENKSNLDEGHASEESHHSKRNVRGRAQQSVRSEAVVTPAAASDGDETEDKRKGRKRELEANTEKESCSSSKLSKAQTPEVKDKIPVQAKRRGRASCAKNTKESPHEVEVKEEKIEEIVEKRGRCRPSAIQKNRKKQQEESENSSNSLEQDTEGQSSEPQTLTSGASRKRQARASSSPVAKTPRSCAASPAPGGRSKAVSQAYKVLFTGVVDESGERVLARLGGSMAKGVADMNCLVTDKVRRTVKFLCAMAKGIPIVTTHWLEKSGKAGSFLPTDAFLVKDAEQETKFSFCLHESLRTARSQPLLQGYEIHVTKSVKPEPVYMKDIISCSGATFLPKMPSSLKPQTVVVSCEEDRALCGPAVAASLPVVTAEFILTGILQQRVDFQSHALSVAPVQPAGGRGRGRKKT